MANADYGQGQGTLTRAAGMVAEARADFTSISHELSGKIQSVQSQFVGQGGSAFFALHQAWTERQRAIVKALDDFADSLQLTERDNVSTDESMGASFHNLSHRLG